MEEQRLEHDGPMELVARHTSRDRFWTGFEATIYDVYGGSTQTPVFPNHNLSMLVGPPLSTTCRCNGIISRRMQRPGEMDIVPAGCGAAWLDEGPSAFLVINVKPTLLQAAAESMGMNSDREWVVPQLHFKEPRIEHIGWALKAELEDPRFGRLYAESLGLALAAQLVRRGNEQPPTPAGLPKRRLRRVMDYIADNLERDLTLAALAAIAGVGPSHFKGLFHQSTGLPVHQYVIKQRVDRAIFLLTSGALPISEIALLVGFANQSHLARWMRRLTGLSPSALRK